ncbi:hypothetical protein HFU84_08665 [Acidithiobacillus sp. CV18-2]|nr:hypothetical protein [Acidithiobacillus sp. CV18-3]MBU2756964.1 hypothetical protein [Acidithiobacillus sp. BN09-2]MBU2777575.1 hypothetical protein [Acidithiobacillus sp. CV18-2]MBU2799675.1 hypothetical protein [Acidithiobacillus sp. VAN18-4]
MARYRFTHHGTLIAEIGALTWFLTMLLAWGRSEALPIGEFWIGLGLVAGLLLILGGIGLEMWSHDRPLSDGGMVHLHWLARFCPLARALVERGHHPTWSEAFQVEEQCWKRKR